MRVTVGVRNLPEGTKWWWAWAWPYDFVPGTPVFWGEGSPPSTRYVTGDVPFHLAQWLSFFAQSPIREIERRNFKDVTFDPQFRYVCDFATSELILEKQPHWLELAWIAGGAVAILGFIAWKTRL